MEAFSFYYESVSREFHSSRNMLSTASLRSCIILQSGAGLIYFHKNNRANLCGEKKSTMKHPGVSKLKQTSSPLVRVSTPDDKRVTRSKLA